MTLSFEASERATPICWADLKAPLRKVDRKDMHLCHHLPFLRKHHHGAKQAS